MNIFLDDITRGYENGDCILLENIDSDGNITHALIDTGRIKGGIVCYFLKKHMLKNFHFYTLNICMLIMIEKQFQF